MNFNDNNTSNLIHFRNVVFSCGIFISLSKCLDVPSLGQDAFSASGANGTIISCNKENEELNHKISKEFLEDLNTSKTAKMNTFHGKKLCFKGLKTRIAQKDSAVIFGSYFCGASKLQNYA